MFKLEFQMRAMLGGKVLAHGKGENLKDAMSRFAVSLEDYEASHKDLVSQINEAMPKLKNTDA